MPFDSACPPLSSEKDACERTRNDAGFGGILFMHVCSHDDFAESTSFRSYHGAFRTVLSTVLSYPDDLDWVRVKLVGYFYGETEDTNSCRA